MSIIEDRFVVCLLIVVIEFQVSTNLGAMTSGCSPMNPTPDWDTQGHSIAGASRKENYTKRLIAR